MLEEDNLWVAFKYFDAETHGKITLDDIHSSLLGSGCEVSHQDIEDISREFGLASKDCIDFNCFKQIMKKINDFTPLTTEKPSPIECFIKDRRYSRSSSDVHYALKSTKISERLTPAFKRHMSVQDSPLKAKEQLLLMKKVPSSLEL